MKILILLYVFLITFDLFAIGLNFEVKKISGTVKARLPFTSGWEMLSEGDELPENTLLNVTTSSRVTLKSYINKFGVKEYKDLIAINSARIMRLNSKSFKKMTSKTMVINRFPDMKTSKELVGKPEQAIKDAFKNLIAFIRKPPEKKSLSSEETEYSSVAKLHKPIRIFHPSDGEFIKVEKFPNEVVVIWSKIKEKKAKYKIFIWKKGQERGDPSYYSETETVNIKLLFPGSYYLQVMSLDETWQSKVNLFHRYGFKRLKSEKNKEPLVSDATIKEPVIDLYTPKDNFHVLGTKKINLTFNWEDKSIPGYDKQYIIILEDLLSEKSRKFYSDVNTITLSISDGNYTWYVIEKLIKYNTIQTIYSEKFRLKVKAGSSAKLMKERIKSLFQSGEDGTLFFTKKVINKKKQKGWK